MSSNEKHAHRSLVSRHFCQLNSFHTIPNAVSSQFPSKFYRWAIFHFQWVAFWSSNWLLTTVLPLAIHFQVFCTDMWRTRQTAKIFTQVELIQWRVLGLEPSIVDICRMFFLSFFLSKHNDIPQLQKYTGKFSLSSVSYICRRYDTSLFTSFLLHSRSVKCQTISLAKSLLFTNRFCFYILSLIVGVLRERDVKWKK